MASRRPKSKHLKVVELFAGVGGFRIGLDKVKLPNVGEFETVWANQWEPSTMKQHAAWTYDHAFRNAKGGPLSNEDIEKVVEGDIDRIPPHDILTGGFPCQDYSVARPLSQAKGLEGRKGILWWSIYEILHHKLQAGTPVRYIFLENVDRLLKSPTSNRGRDFAIMLSCLADLGYTVEWRVINAGEYGFPQRRRRTFILGYLEGSKIAKETERADPAQWIMNSGVFARSFPIKRTDVGTTWSFDIDAGPFDISKKGFHPSIEGAYPGKVSPFQNAGYMRDGHVTTIKVKPRKRKTRNLGDIVAVTDEASVPEEFYIPPAQMKKWEEQKGSHSFERKSRDGHIYKYSEGAIPFPDPLDRPSRTIITSEGGRSPSRFKHVVDIRFKPGFSKGRTIKGKTYTHRRLTPEELEALCMFRRGHTKKMRLPDGTVADTPHTKRAFFMGNALVVGVITKVGKELLKRA